MADPYRTGGKLWDSVNTVVRRCQCTESRAITALKICNNDVERAIRSVTGFWRQSPPRRTRPVANLEPEINTPPSSDDDAPEVVPPPETARAQSPEIPADLEILTPETPQRDDLQQYALPILNLERVARKFLPREGSSRHFSLARLLFALQNQAISDTEIHEYFSYFQQETIRASLNQDLKRVPSIFYVVATNNIKVIKIWVDFGADVNAVDKTCGIPVLAFAIINSLAVREDTTETVAFLLANGAKASMIPSPFLGPCLGDLAVFDPSKDSPSDETAWCKALFWDQLHRAINITQRYFLSRARLYKPPSVRLHQAATQYNVSALFGLPFWIVGQNLALEILTDQLLGSFVLQGVKPLVLMFAGPSGHGKTELGKRLGEVLSLEIQTIDMTEMKYETDLFGPRAPFIDHEVGSPLNNFLCAMSGKRAIVLLDEFEKSSKEVWHSLLILFDEGKYVDRRSRRPVDCSKIIWIVATNALDSIISEFSKSNEGCGKDTDDVERSSQLQSLLISGSKAKFGFPLTGRISMTIPFMPFSVDEQAVIAHKYLLQLAKKVRRPLSLPRQMIGNVVLGIPQEVAVCKAIIKDCYDSDTGARSIEAAVKVKVEGPLVRQYLAVNAAIEENQEPEEYTIKVDQDSRIKVEAGGTPEMEA